MRLAPTLHVRNFRFPVDESVPRYWHGGRRAITAFFNNLSIFFPPGERFFIASVRAHRHLIEDGRLAEEVRAFCQQEGCHSREHAHYNELLREQGYPVEDMERRVEELLALVTRHAPARRRLAVTCALEHFTALMAHMLLGDARLLEGAHPVMAALWRWHAAEEGEHKAVAFDVYRVARGPWLERCAVMLNATWIFWLKIIEQQVRFMRADGTAGSPGEWASLLRYLFVAPGGMFTVWRLWLDYFRPGFHPWNLDTRALLEAWKLEFAISPVYQQARVARR